LTLARIPEDQGGAVAAPLEHAIARTSPPNATMKAEAVALMRSELQRGGAVYSQLFAAPLTG
jgi:2'-5' RNA ligase